MTAEELKERLESYKELDMGWDGYHAMPIPHAVIDTAIQMIPMMGEGVEIFPTGRKSIQFEWEDENSYIELEIYEHTEEHKEEGCYAEIYVEKKGKQ